MARTAVRRSVVYTKKTTAYTFSSYDIPRTLYSVPIRYSYCFHNSNMFWLIAGSTLSYCPDLAQRLYTGDSEAHRSVGPVSTENAQGSKLSMFFILLIFFCTTSRIDDRFNLPSIGMTESMPTISTIQKSSVNLIFTRSNLLILW